MHRFRTSRGAIAAALLAMLMVSGPVAVAGPSPRTVAGAKGEAANKDTKKEKIEIAPAAGDTGENNAGKKEKKKKPTVGVRSTGMKIRGVPVEPMKAFYLVAKDVNVRTKPDTKGKKLATYKKGTRLKAVGRPKEASWLAVEIENGEPGFVYTPALLPLIDGTLEAEITGSAKVGRGLECAYVIRFEGKSAVQDEFFETADYEIAFDCRRRGKSIAFPALMFITEVPYRLTAAPVHQINIDVVEIEGGVEEVFSTVFLYDRSKGSVAYDSVTMSAYRGDPKVKEKPAKSVARALAAAAAMAVGAWNDKAWRAIVAGPS